MNVFCYNNHANVVNIIPESALTSVVIDDLIFDMDFVGVRLSDYDQRAFGFWSGPLFDPIVACDVPGIGSWKVGRLYPAQFPVTLVEYSVAIATHDHLSPPRLESAVSITQVRVAFP